MKACMPARNFWAGLYTISILALAIMAGPWSACNNAYAAHGVPHAVNPGVPVKIPPGPGGGAGPLNPSDVDGDGYNAATDCDDNDAAVNPGATEACNGVDDNCDGQIDGGDADGDGALRVVIDPTTGEVVCGDDCDDADRTRRPGNPESCDGIDNDCSGQIDDDPACSDTGWETDAGDTDTDTDAGDSDTEDGELDNFPIPEDCQDLAGADLTACLAEKAAEAGLCSTGPAPAALGPLLLFMMAILILGSRRQPSAVPVSRG